MVDGTNAAALALYQKLGYTYYNVAAAGISASARPSE
jgi:hypothetical protein